MYSSLRSDALWEISHLLSSQIVSWTTAVSIFPNWINSNQVPSWCGHPLKINFPNVQHVPVLCHCSKHHTRHLHLLPRRFVLHVTDAPRSSLLLSELIEFDESMPRLGKIYYDFRPLVELIKLLESSEHEWLTDSNTEPNFNSLCHDKK